MPVRCTCGRQKDNPNGKCGACIAFDKAMDGIEGNSEDKLTSRKANEKGTKMASKKCAKCNTEANSNGQRTCKSCGEKLPQGKKKAVRAKGKGKTVKLASILSKTDDTGTPQSVVYPEGLLDKLQAELAKLTNAIEVIRRYA